MVQSFLSFVKQSPTAFQAVAALRARLEEAGFVPLNEAAAWNIAPGGRYFVTRNGSALIAFAVPAEGARPFQMVASHSDSPMFKLKPLCEDAAAGCTRLNVERYGGTIYSTWFDRPLGIAGRVLVWEGGRLLSRLVDLGRDAALIPNMPIHFNREVNDGYKYNPQVDLLPVYGLGGQTGRLMEEVARKLNVRREAIAGADLFVYNRMEGTVWGPENELFSCPRIDDLECAFASVEAFAQSTARGHINLCAVLDNEEVGSGTKQGADSTFLSDVCHRVCASLGATDAQTRALIAASFLVSADNAHALHPNHPEKYDAQNRTQLNGGVVIKHNANQSYATDGVSAAIFSSLCAEAGVPVQHFANRSDVPGGSTLGHIANAHVSMNTVDIGLAQWAMHSAYETAGVKDLRYLADALRMFYQTTVRFLADGTYSLEEGR